MKVTGVRSLYTKLWRLSDELGNDARRLADGGDNELAAATEQIALACRQLAEKIGTEIKT